jgi:hypothetical protein
MLIAHVGGAMRTAFNSWLVVLGIVILAILVVSLERHLRRSTAHSSMSGRHARVTANDALRRRLAGKFDAQVVEAKQRLEKIRE